MLYDDDGVTFDHRRGEWMKIAMTWQDGPRRLTLRLAGESRMLPPSPRRFQARVAGTPVTKSIVFTGQSADIRM
jgi:hypothetical protein